MTERGFSAKLVFSGSTSDCQDIAAAIEGMADAADAVSEFISGPGAHTLEAYYSSEAIALQVANSLSSTLSVELARQVRLEKVARRNWVAEVERGSPPLKIGRFLVHGTHNREAARGSHFAIEIEAGLAFGTGRHATTAGCLLAIDEFSRRRAVRSVLDVGCGSGVLAIAAAKAMSRASIVASDIDPIAVAVTRRNARINGVSGRVEVLRAAGLADGRLNRRFELILANILAGPLCSLAGDMANRLAPGGTIVLAGLLNHEAQGVAATYRAAGFHLMKRMRIEGWSILVMVRH